MTNSKTGITTTQIEVRVGYQGARTRDNLVSSRAHSDKSVEPQRLQRGDGAVPAGTIYGRDELAAPRQLSRSGEAGRLGAGDEGEANLSR
jgi:hypothetical protein